MRCIQDIQNHFMKFTPLPFRFLFTEDKNISNQNRCLQDKLKLCIDTTVLYFDQVAKHLSKSYGIKAPEVAKMAKMTGKRWPVVGERLVDEFPYIEAEVHYGIQVIMLHHI